MESLKVKTHIGADGMLRLELPVDVANTDVELVSVMQSVAISTAFVNPIMSEELKETARKNGWPDGFFEETYGTLAANPIERPKQPPLEIRDEILDLLSSDL